MVIHEAHKIKLVQKSLLVLLASIEASLRYTIEPDMAAGYALLKENAHQVISRLNPTQPLALEHYFEQRVVLDALNKIIQEHENMQKDHTVLTAMLIELFNEVLKAHHKEIHDPESRKKIPAHDTLVGRLRPSGLGSP